MRLAKTEMEVILRIFCFCQTPERNSFLFDNCRNWRHKTTVHRCSIYEETVLQSQRTNKERNKGLRSVLLYVSDIKYNLW